MGFAAQSRVVTKSLEPPSFAARATVEARVGTLRQAGCQRPPGGSWWAELRVPFQDALGPSPPPSLSLSLSLPPSLPLSLSLPMNAKNRYRYTHFNLHVCVYIGVYIHIDIQCIYMYTHICLRRSSAGTFPVRTLTSVLSWASRTFGPCLAEAFGVALCLLFGRSVVCSLRVFLRSSSTLP